MKVRESISFPAFFLEWADFKGWDVPDFHVEIALWLQERGRKAVLEVFRGAAKSTLAAIYQAWKLREDRTYRFLDRGADDDTAQKLTADTKNVLALHRLCRGMLPRQAGVEKFSIIGNPDARNASVTAYGVMSNATSSRADEIINDDPEVPKNIKTPDGRLTLRQRLSEEVHILTPGGKILYIGTPHTHNSIYDEKSNDGYDTLKITLFKHHQRHEANGKTKIFPFKFTCKDDDLYVMVGRELLDFHSYWLKDNTIVLPEAPSEGTIIDLYAGNAWPQRFTREEIKLKRGECKTQNEWDSQYLLKARPIHEIRLNPDKLVVYEDNPVIRCANGATSLSICDVEMISCRAYWDCSLGKPDSDDSAFAAMFSDDKGHFYWQVLDVLKGGVYEQCEQITKRVIEYQIPNIRIETNGPGGFLPAILRKAFREKGIECGIAEEHVKGNKTKRILDAYEAPLSGDFLHVHKSVFEGGLAEQMQDWIPEKVNQSDDLLDAGAGCIKNLPVRIGKIVSNPKTVFTSQWDKNRNEQYEVSVEF